MAARGGAVWTIPVVPMRGYRLAVEGFEGLEEVVVDDVTLKFLLHPVPRAVGVGVPEVKVDLDEGGVDL